MASLPAAYFGMNLVNGFESSTGLFLPVVQGSMLAGVLAAGTMWLYYRWGPRRRYQARLRDMRSLRDLLVFHMDELDDILEAVKHQSQAMVSKDRFREIVQQVCRRCRCPARCRAWAWRRAWCRRPRAVRSAEQALACGGCDGRPRTGPEPHGALIRLALEL